jgi:hypothetical protein
VAPDAWARAYGASDLSRAIVVCATPQVRAMSVVSLSRRRRASALLVRRQLWRASHVNAAALAAFRLAELPSMAPGRQVSE